MSNSPVTVGRIEFTRIFPWLRLFRAFWIAADPRKLILAALALVLIAAGDWGISQLPFAPQDERSTAAQPAETVRGKGWPWDQSLDYDLWHGSDALAELRGGWHSPWHTLQRIALNWQLALRPFDRMLDPARGILQAAPSWSNLAYETTRLLWALCVWAVFGGALGRMVAIQFARDQKIGIRQALAFSLGRFLDYLSAPLLPLSAVAGLWCVCALAGTLGRIPVAGEWIVGLLWGVALVLGLMMAIVLIGVAAGWPLMFATVSVEASDGFDGLSRAYNYVFERPLHYLWYVLVMMFFGSLVTFFVWLVGQTVFYLAAASATWGFGPANAAGLFAGAPRLIVPASLFGGEMPPPANVQWGALFVGIWLRGLATLVIGFVYSYFWTSTTIMYFLLRRQVDANDLDEVHFDEESQPDDLLPLVGIAATDVPAAVAAVAPSNGEASAADAQEQVAPPVDLTP